MPELHRLALVSNEGYFSEFTESCSIHLDGRGFETGMLSEIPSDDDWDAVLVIGIHNFLDLPFLGRTKLLGIQTEQLPIGKSPVGRLRRNLKRFHSVCGFYDQLFEWNPSLFEAGVGGDMFIPYGCKTREPSNCEKEFDVLFIGNVAGSPRRTELLNNISRRFKFYPDFSPGFGRHKTEAIQASKICLNIHYYDDFGFESPRIFDYLSHGAFVIGEVASSTHPFVVGCDLEDFTDQNELEEKITYYLKNDKARLNIADDGFKRATFYNYEFTSRLIAEEVKRVLNLRSNSAKRWRSWSQARAKCSYFAFRDYISLKRRGMS